MRNIKILLALLVMWTTSSSLFAADDSDGIQKVVYQCDFANPKRVHLMLNTLNNLVAHNQKNLVDFDIAVVALGPCLQYVMKNFKGTGFAGKPYLTHGGPAGNGTTGRLKALKIQAGDNITIFACENTMDKKNVKKEQLLDIVKTTPGGILKIIELESKGYAYIKIM